MLTRTVSLNDAGHPFIRVRVYGLSEEFAQEFDALIDTGFTGFMMLPLTVALPLGLTLMSTATYTLGDGSATFQLIAFGTVEYEGQKVVGPISLELGVNCKDILLGMDFIRQSKQMLLLSSLGAAFFDMTEVAEKMAKHLEDRENEEEAALAPPHEIPAAPPSESN